MLESYIFRLYIIFRRTRKASREPTVSFSEISHRKSAKPFHPHRELGASEGLQANEASAWLCSSKTSTLLNAFCSVAQNRHHPGDRRLPGEEAGRRGRPLHRPAHARLPGGLLETTLTPLEELLRGSGCLLTLFHCALKKTQPPQFKLDPRLARMLGIHTQTRPVIIQALWQYVKTHKLQDPHEREFINCDKYLQQVRGRLAGDEACMKYVIGVLRMLQSACSVNV